MIKQIIAALNKAAERNELNASYGEYSDIKSGVRINTPEAVVHRRNAQLWRECAEDILKLSKERI